MSTSGSVATSRGKSRLLTETLGAVHRRLLERRRHTLNLVGPGPIEPHFLDCAAALEVVPSVPDGERWVDIGSGAGFPGLVFAERFPNIAVDLVEVRKKRAVFLEAVLAEAHAIPRAAPVRVLAVSADTLSEQWDGGMSRAFTAPIDALAAATRWIRPGGRWVLFLQDEPAPSHPAWTLQAEHRYTVDGKTRRSALLVHTS
jgi:16S rRNA G527 N7-methylase RsmG